MPFLIVAFIFIFGLIVGSFLNVIIFRYNTGVGVGGRSGCMSCGATLKWYELIPVFSFIIQRGKCRNCGSRLSMQYPAVELATGLVFTAVFFKFAELPITPINIVSFLIALVIWCLLIMIFVYDLRHKIIPDSMVYIFALLGLINVLISLSTQPSSNIFLSLLAGPILFLPFFLIWLASSGRWIGLGDAKLELGMGFILGIGYGFSALVLAVWIGGFLSLLVMLFERLKSSTKHLTIKSEIPFAPYLIIGFSLVYFFSIDVLGIHNLFQI